MADLEEKAAVIIALEEPFDDLQAWRKRLHEKIYKRYAPRYLASGDRDRFIKTAFIDLSNKIARVEADSYLYSIVHIWMQGVEYQVPLSDTLKLLAKTQQKYYDIHTASFDAKEMLRLEEVDDFVEFEELKYIVAFILHIETYEYFRNVLKALHTARKRGGLRDLEEQKILRKAELREPMEVVESNAVVGFKWHGDKEKNDKRIEALYNWLIQKNYIGKVELETFRILFSDKPVDKRVTWLKNSRQLLLFLDALIDKEFIFLPSLLAEKRKRAHEIDVSKSRGKTGKKESEELQKLRREINLWLFTRSGACFQNKKGVPYDAKILRHTYNDMHNKQKYSPKAAVEFENLAVELMKI